MKSLLKTIFNIPARIRESNQLDAEILAASIPVFVLGTVLQYPDWPIAEYIPQFYRHHLTNCVDALGLASIMNLALSSTFKRNACLVSGGLAIAIGRDYELDQAEMIGRSFDGMDMSIYTASIAFYLLAHYANRERSHSENNSHHPLNPFVIG
jgi:hypothetical protein